METLSPPGPGAAQLRLDLVELNEDVSHPEASVAAVQHGGSALTQRGCISGGVVLHDAG